MVLRLTRDQWLNCPKPYRRRLGGVKRQMIVEILETGERDWMDVDVDVVTEGGDATCCRGTANHERSGRL